MSESHKNPIPIPPAFQKPDEFFEGCGREGPLRAIFLAEFDPTQGPKIRHLVPEEKEDTEGVGAKIREAFEAISVYVIPKAQLARRTITLTTLGLKILGYPIVLEDKKYKRNQFMFNVCFVCHPWSRSVSYNNTVNV